MPILLNQSLLTESTATRFYNPLHKFPRVLGLDKDDRDRLILCTFTVLFCRADSNQNPYYFMPSRTQLCNDRSLRCRFFSRLLSLPTPQTLIKHWGDCDQSPAVHPSKLNSYVNHLDYHQSCLLVLIGKNNPSRNHDFVININSQTFVHVLHW